jgi:hypothetical protein
MRELHTFRRVHIEPDDMAQYQPAAGSRQRNVNFMSELSDGGFFPQYWGILG